MTKRLAPYVRRCNNVCLLFLDKVFEKCLKRLPLKLQKHLENTPIFVMFACQAPISNNLTSTSRNRLFQSG